jgi:hypothetical protein
VIVAGQKHSSKARTPAAGRRSPAPPSRVPPRGASHGQVSLSEHKREIVALVLLGVSVFLLVALYGGDAAGAAGRAVRTGLVYAFGRLAFVVPLTFIAVAATTMLQVRFWRSYRFAGVLVFLFGLFLLAGAGAPPFGSHGIDQFVRGDFETRAGGLGESLYALFDRMVGMVGVGIVGWLAELAGLILATGITAVWLGKRTKLVATAVKRTAERSALPTTRREDDLSASLNGAKRPANYGASNGGWSGGSRAVAAPPRLGPVDLVGPGRSESVGVAGNNRAGRAFGDAFGDWAQSRPTSSGAVAAAGAALNEKGLTVVDGAQAFADLYHTGGSESTVAGPTKIVAGPAVFPATGDAKPPIMGEAPSSDEDETV